MNTNIYKESNLEDLLLLFRRNIAEALRKDGFKQDLTFSQVEVLRFIGPAGKETMKRIADYLKIAPPSATEIVAEMEKKGVVARKGNPKDRRIVYIVLTPSAKKLFTSISKRKEYVLNKMVSKLKIEDRRHLERIIRILISK